MANPITTTGTTTDPISTAYQNGQSVKDWVKAHDDAVTASTPSGNTLTTTWMSDAGKKTEPTTRLSGESDTDFKQRHIEKYLLGMLEDPPVA
jgi:hypothetical protein